MSNQSFIKSISDEQKLAYFEELLNRNDEIYLQFENFFKLQNDVRKLSQINSLKELTTKIFADFETINVDKWMRSRGCQYDYYDDENVYEELLEEVFEKYEMQVDDYISHLKLYEALFLCVAIYKALVQEPSIKDEHYYLFGDSFSDNALASLRSIMSNVSNELNNPIVSQEEIQRCITFLIKNINEDEDESLNFFISFFQKIITTVEIAKFTQQFLNKFPAIIQLDILELLKKDNEYIKVAEQFYLENSNIAVLLLNKLHQLNDYQSYEKIATKIFEKYPTQLSAKILEVITYEQTPKLYVEALKIRCRQTSSVTDYKELKTYLSESEVIDFRKNIESSFSTNFYIAILEEEKMYDVLLALAKRTLEKGLNNDLKKYLNPIKEIYPQEVLEMVITHCNGGLTEQGRNRMTYQRMVEYLKILKNVQSIQSNFKEYINTTLHTQRLPALKDELKKAGF